MQAPAVDVVGSRIRTPETKAYARPQTFTCRGVSQAGRTPTIIYQGSEGTQCPPGEGWTYFRTLQELGKVPVRFISVPGEGHSPSKYVEQRRKIDEDMGWFDRYLFGVPESAADPCAVNLAHGSPH